MNKTAFALALVCMTVVCASTSLSNVKGKAKASRKQKEREQAKDTSAAKDFSIIVNDRPLTGPHASVQQRGSRLFLPVVTIARALGDEPLVNLSNRSIEIRRQDGIVSDFSLQLNQIRENGAAILVVSNTADLIFPPNPDELMLPVEIVSALVGASVITDKSSCTIRITRGQPQSGRARTGAQHGAWELYLMEHTSNFNMYSTSMNYNVALHSSGRINDGKFDLLSDFDGAPGYGSLVFRRGSFAYDRPNGQRFILGDFGTGNDLEFMSSRVRGAFAQRPINDMRLTVFGGRTQSDSSRLAQFLDDPIINLPAESQRYASAAYDTNVLGSYVTFGPSVKDPSRPTLLLFSAGGSYFSSPLSSGQSLSGSVKYNSHRHQFQGDFGAGNFSGISFPGSSRNTREVSGLAPMVDVAEVFNLRDNLTLQGRFMHIGANFLSPQSSGLLMPLKLLSGGVSWRAFAWLNASFNALSRTKLDTEGEGEQSLSASINITPRGWLPTINVTHTQGRNVLAGGTSYTLANVTKEFNRWRLFGNFTRISNTVGVNPFATYKQVEIPPSQSVTGGAIVRAGENHSFQFSQTFASGGSLGGSADWMTSSFFTKRVSFGAGFSYSYSNSRIITTERFLTTIELPRKQMLQVTYVQTPNGPQVIAQLRGLLFSSPRAEIALTTPVAELNLYGAFYGKVYQDLNLNGRFDEGVDQPLENVSVRVDGAYFAATDGRGDFRIENVKSGEHTVYLDLLSVRADLTLLDSAQQLTMLRPGHDSIVDFRLVRTGRIKGIVWLDANGNGKVDAGEEPLGDVRVVTGSGRDTLTDATGEYVISDLPPGEHIVLIDEKTLPETAKLAINSLQVMVKAGAETGGANFPVVAKPVETEIKKFPSR